MNCRECGIEMEPVEGMQNRDHEVCDDCITRKVMAYIAKKFREEEEAIGDKG